jgi:hypothetical protein
MKQALLTRIQSIYILCLISLMVGFGRIISTIAYKVNDSNVKSRIFSYNLTLILSGLAVFLATFVCDTSFSFAMFAITFGGFCGTTKKIIIS